MGRVGIRAGEWPLILLIAVAVAVPVAFAPVLALAAAAVLIVLGFVVFNAGALLLLMVAAFPWDDMLGYPTETISMIKLLGALLLVGYFLRSLARDEDVRLPPTLPSLVIFTMLVLLSLMASGDVASGLSKTLRYLLFAAFSFLVVQLIRSRAQMTALLRVLVVSSTAAALYGVVLLIKGDVDRVSGPIGEANDFAYLLASVLPFAVYLTLRDRRWRTWWVLSSGVLILALLGTLSRGALVGLAAVVLWAVATRRTRFGGVLAGLFVIAGVLALALTLWRPLIDERLAAKQKVATANVESRKEYWRAAALDGGRPAAAGRRARALRDREPQLRPQRPAQHRGPGRPQRLPGGAGRGRVPDAAGLPGVHRRVLGADLAGAKTVSRRRRRRRAARDGRRTGLAGRGDRLGELPLGADVGAAVAARRAGGGARARAAAARVKVALVTSLERGGPLEHAVLLARDLVTLGADVRAVAVDERVAERFDAVGARVAVLPLVRPFDPAGAVRVRRFVAGADVVHTHDRRSGLWVRVLRARGRRARATRCTASRAVPDRGSSLR